MKLTPFREKSIILTLTLLAFLLRAYRLAEQSYWIDEAWTIFYAHLSLSELWVNLQTIRAAPPLYHVLTIYWVQLVGDGEYALRFLSLVASVLAIPLAYRLGQALGDRRLGLLTALLLTVSPYQIWHAQDARNYSMLTAASMMSMWGFINLWRRGGWRWQFIYIIGSEWAVLTHYHGLVVIGVQGLFFLVTWRRHWRYYLPWAGALLLIFLPLAAWLIFGSTLWQSQHWLPFVGLGDSYLRSAIAYSIGELVPRPLAFFLSAAFVALYLIGLLYAARRRWGSWRGGEMAAFLLIYTLAPNIAVWLYSRLGTPVYLERYLIPVQVGFLLTVAAGILAIADLRLPRSPAPLLPCSPAPLLPRSPAPPLLRSLTPLLILIGLSLWTLNQHYHNDAYAKPNWRGVIDMIEAYSQPGDAILLTGDGGEKLFDYYYRGDLTVYDDFNTPVPPPDQARQRLSQIAAAHQRLWYTPYGVDIDATLEQWLAENSFPAWHSWLGRKRLALYDTRAALDRVETVETTFANAQNHRLKLVSLALPNDSIPAGDLLPLKLTWQAETPLAHDYQLSLRLLNPAGDLFAQSDWPPLAAGRGTSTWPVAQPMTDRRSLWLPPDLPPGQYVLQFVLYESDSGASLGQPLIIQPIDIAPAQITPPLESLPIPNPIRQSLGPVILAGYAAPERIQPGQEMWLWLYWFIPANGENGGGPHLDAETLVRLSLTSGPESVTGDFSLVDSAGPPERWPAGQVRRAVYHLPTSPRLAGQQATLSLALVAPGEQIGANIDLTTVELEQRPRQFERPAIEQPTDIALGRPPQLKLIGYDLPVTTLAPGDALPLTLYWQAEAEMRANYTVFVQLLDDNQQVVAQIDAQPLAGAAPTTTWLPGEIIADAYTLALPPDLSPGKHRLITGMYNPVSGERLPLSSGGDFVEVRQVTVK